MPVFGADMFRPIAQGAPPSYGRRPGHREDAFILDGELELQPLALVVGVDSYSVGNRSFSRDADILLFAPFLGFAAS